MNNIVLPLVALLVAFSGPKLLAQTTPAPEVEQGFDLIEEGAKLLLRGILSQAEPAMKDMGEALKQIEPALKVLQPRMMELLALVDDLQNYLPPERLENGDIIIRRKPDAPAPPALPEPVPGDGAMEL
jgi:hypothetical protein